MDEQPRPDKRSRPESEDLQALEATPREVKVYRTSCNGVKTLMHRKNISFYDAKCREQNPECCPGLCCSHCTNPSCPFPRGAMCHRRGVYVVRFKEVGGQIMCQVCAAFLSKHGFCRSEAVMATLSAAHAQKARALMAQLNSSLGPSHGAVENSRPADPVFVPNTTGESVSCDLSAVLESVCVSLLTVCNCNVH